MTAGLIDVPPTTGVGDQYVYGLRTCNAKFEAHGGFVWPREGWIEAPDWNPDPICGGGLHFLRDGEGDAGLLNHNNDAVWMVVRAPAPETVDIDGAKSKARRCEVIFAGGRVEAVTLLRGLVGPSKHIVCANDRIAGTAVNCGDGSTITAKGDGSTITAKGSRSTITAEGDDSTITAKGSRSTITAEGDDSTITAKGYVSTITAKGYGSTITAKGYGSTITAKGDDSTITAKGDDSTITAKGYGSTITAKGSRSTITAEGDGATITAKGDDATITAKGYGATITAGRNSFVVVRWWDTEGRRYRFAQASVGDGETLKPDTPYRYVNGVWVEVVA